ncbi:uncharacterized protein KY384_007332 [Bacidia gigantensis]|uniref:uncharacterized protein n=1 Tax=Bacidia gigantensis TaxID=2732470 RepID=UPI001D046780|nr:uncharacterized protein KY384_007332 [Bacidia gigantensis]KAG8528414.1 hypothetical protein KY384_007332 [Bacidia gigantensis]
MVEPTTSSSSEVNFKIQDEGRLAELGYTQELRREWSLIHNFGASFSIISVTTGIGQQFGYGLLTGGPAVMTIGWIVGSFFTLVVGASMAEILSGIPTSGGPYFWAYMLSPTHRAPFFSWITGWFNLLGQVAVTTAIDFGLATIISETAHVASGYKPSAGGTLGIHAVILLSHVCVNLLSIRTLKYIIYTSVTLNTAGVFCLCVAILAKAPKLQSAKFVFATFYDGTANSDADVGWSIRASPAYVAVTGLLLTQYTILGFDASAHLCEETRKAVRDAPYGLIGSIGASAVIGFFLLLSLLFAIGDFEAVRSDPLPMLRVLTDACGKTGGIVLMCSNSRMMFAFARDGGIPHRLHIIDRRFKSPVRTVAFGATLSFLLALPSLGSRTAFAGTTAIATIGLYISYGIPIFLTLLYPHNFKRGPFNLNRYLGRWGSTVTAVVAIAYIIFITVVFCLPTVNPVTSNTLNYTPVAVGIVGAGAFGSWYFWAKNWFTGRCRHHCRVCIRQLDLLGEELGVRMATGDSDGGDEPLKLGGEGVGNGGGAQSPRFGPGVGHNGRRYSDGRREKKGLRVTEQ